MRNISIVTRFDRYTFRSLHVSIVSRSCSPTGIPELVASAEFLPLLTLPPCRSGIGSASAVYDHTMPCIRTFALLTAALGPFASLYAQQADMVLVHGTVLTVDSKDSVAQAIAIRSGGIIAVGTDAQIMKL